jgi:hypothetical protein
LPLSNETLGGFRCIVTESESQSRQLPARIRLPGTEAIVSSSVSCSGCYPTSTRGRHKRDKHVSSRAHAAREVLAGHFRSHERPVLAWLRAAANTWAPDFTGSLCHLGQVSLVHTVKDSIFLVYAWYIPEIDLLVTRMCVWYIPGMYLKVLNIPLYIIPGIYLVYIWYIFCQTKHTKHIPGI